MREGLRKYIESVSLKTKRRRDKEVGGREESKIDTEMHRDERSGGPRRSKVGSYVLWFLMAFWVQGPVFHEALLHHLLLRSA